MSRYAKAFATFIGTTLGIVGTWGIAAAPDGIDTVDWFALLIGLSAIFGTTGAVYGIPNTPPTGQLADPHMSEQHDPSI